MIAPLRVVALRHIGVGHEAIASALAAHGLPPLPNAGRFAGNDPFVLWRNPGESLLISLSSDVADLMLRELAPGRASSACAIDLSDGIVCLELRGSALHDLLSRLIDASAIPQRTGDGTQARLGEIAVSIIRRADDCAWLLADRSVAHYVADWVAYASDRMTRAAV